VLEAVEERWTALWSAYEALNSTEEDNMETGYSFILILIPMSNTGRIVTIIIVSNIIRDYQSIFLRIIIIVIIVIMTIRTR
jgi:hypothetical protein